MLLFTLDAAFPPTERLYALYLENTVLALGIVLLLQFAYHFPEPFPRKWEALLVLGLSLCYLWLEASFAARRYGLVSSAGQVIFRGTDLDQYLALCLLWAPVVLLRQSLRASAATAPLGENGAEHPERRAAARSRRVRSGRSP